jgi:hypothetical protein
MVVAVRVVTFGVGDGGGGSAATGPGGDSVAAGGATAAPGAFGAK